jgi:hypothetical protein
MVLMSVRPCPGAEVPALTARIARASNPGGTTAMWVRDRLDGLWQDEDFAGWYSRDGLADEHADQLTHVELLGLRPGAQVLQRLVSV